MYRRLKKKKVFQVILGNVHSYEPGQVRRYCSRHKQINIARKEREGILQRRTIVSETDKVARCEFIPGRVETIQH